MTSYNLKPITLRSLAVQEAKEKRRKILEAVRKRRYQIAKDRQAKEQQAYQQNEEHTKYQEMLKEEASLYR